MKSIIFWDVRPCSLLSCNRRFGGTYRLHLHGRRKISASKQVASLPWGVWSCFVRSCSSKKDRRFGRTFRLNLQKSMQSKNLFHPEEGGGMFLQRIRRRYNPWDRTFPLLILNKICEWQPQANCHVRHDIVKGKRLSRGHLVIPLCRRPCWWRHARR
jgi:hypothetical protein